MRRCLVGSILLWFFVIVGGDFGLVYILGIVVVIVFLV